MKVCTTLNLFPFCFISQIAPETLTLNVRTDRKVSKLGVMLVGWGGNNGSTLTAALEANRRKLQWRKRTGVQAANWFGSLTQSSTVLIGTDEEGKDVHLPMNELVPMVDPDEIGKVFLCLKVICMPVSPFRNERLKLFSMSVVRRDGELY